jgi:hypothetical protein
MTIITTAWGLGMVAGAGMGGILADPTLIESINSPFLNAYPYVLPSLLACCMGMLSCIVGYCLLPETIHLKRKKAENIEMKPAAATSNHDLKTHGKSNEPLALQSVTVVDQDATADGDNEDNADSENDLEQLIPSGQKKQKRVRFFDPNNKRHRERIARVHAKASRPPDEGSAFADLANTQETNIDAAAMDAKRESNEELQSLVPGQKNSSDSESDSNATNKLHTSKKPGRLRALASDKTSALSSALAKSSKTDSVFMSFMRDAVVVRVVVIYSVFSFASIGFDELFPLWASTSWSLGGLSWPQRNSEFCLLRCRNHPSSMISLISLISLKSLILGDLYPHEKCRSFFMA